jgi:hypothetical protein
MGLGLPQCAGLPQGGAPVSLDPNVLFSESARIDQPHDHFNSLFPKTFKRNIR